MSHWKTELLSEIKGGRSIRVLDLLFRGLSNIIEIDEKTIETLGKYSDMDPSNLYHFLSSFEE